MANQSPGQQRQFAAPVIQAPFEQSNLTANGVTTIKTGPGMLHSVTINTKGAASNTLKIYDNTTSTGTTIATIDTTANVASLLYDVGFSTGLTVVLATGTAADVAIAWR